jgi:hypothetical protein
MAAVASVLLAGVCCVQSNGVSQMISQRVRVGFMAAAAMNIGGVLLFSRCFTNTAVNQADPVVMSNFGLLVIVLWGLAYLAASSIQANIRWLAATFALEKLVYGVVWLSWLTQHSLAPLYADDLFAGVFYSIYGLNDLAFMVFFAWVWGVQRRVQ